MPFLPQPLRYVILVTIVFAVYAHARAGTVHKLRFQQTGIVVAWQDGELVGQGPRLDIGPELPPALPGSGQLAPVLTSSVSPDQSMRLQLASNTGFAIEIPATYAATAIEVRVIDIGANAQSQPAMLSNGTQGTFGRVIFEHRGKTARSPGSPESQAITLEIGWSGAARPALIIHAD